MEVAEKAASFIRKHVYDPSKNRLQRSFRNGPSKAPGFLDDYAFLISGLLDLYECGGSIFWLTWAMELQDTQVGTSEAPLILFQFWVLAFYSDSNYYSRINFSLIKLEEVISTHQVKILPFSSV